MKLIQINSTSGIGSTGKICVAISNLLTDRSIENYILYSLGRSNHQFSIKYSSNIIRLFQALLEKITGRNGFFSIFSTLQLIRIIKRITPDIIHLHNVHSHDVDLKILFRYLRKMKIKLFWTFHDCWAFTGGCSHYDMVSCSKWKERCGKCILYKQYSWLIDTSSYNLRNKIKAYSSKLDLTIITPSNWLAEQVQQSFLNGYLIKVINNGIDLNVFKPRESNFRDKYHCHDKFILLGVSFEWNEHKGIDVFEKLARHIDDRFQIVLVGKCDITRFSMLSGIEIIQQTNNQIELAEIYSAADLLLQLTREETFPTVNIESLACGTPIITFNTGGSPEIIDESCGIVVEKDNVSELINQIEYVYNTRPFTKEACISRAKRYNQDSRFLDYINLYCPNNNEL